MTVQPVLFRDATKSKTIIQVPVGQCVISEFNPRRTRSKTDIEALATRIERNGFEVTRALWVHLRDGLYHVFAGGNRLEAVKRTTVREIPVVLHDGYSEDEIVGLADQDNENDEYHAPVSIVDVWMDYKRLSDAGWANGRIARAKGVSDATVSLRLQYGGWPDEILSFFTRGFLKEGHAREIRDVLHCKNLAPWHDRTSATVEIIEAVFKLRGSNAIADDFKARVATYNAFIQQAQDVADRLESVTLYGEDGAPYAYDSRAAFVDELARTKARSVQAVKSAEVTIRKHISDNLARHQERLQEEADKRDKELEKASAPVVLPYRLIVAHAEDTTLGDESVDIIITSPPYNLGAEEWPMGAGGRNSRAGMGYNKHGDAMPQDEYERWQVDVLREMYRVAKPGASFFYNHKVRTSGGVMVHPMRWLLSPDNPWVLRQEIIWDRKSTHNHSATLFWPHDERIYWMTKGAPVLRSESIGAPTIWEEFGPVPGTWHPAPFTEKLPRMLLGAVGVDADMVVLDPFAGSCTTVKVALEMGCQAIGVDISNEYLERAITENHWSHEALH